MNIQQNLITFIIINKKDFQIIVYNIEQMETFFTQKLIIPKKFKNNSINFFEDFFVKKIISIEKEIKNYIENLVLIINKDFFLEVNFSFLDQIKENSKIKDSLSEGLRQFEKYYYDYFLSHYHFNIQKKGNKKVENLEAEYLQMNFICIKKNFVTKIRSILKPHQITLRKIFSYNFLETTKLENETIINAAINSILGLNSQEVQIRKKNTQKKGFFEIFFDYFK